MSEPSTQIVIAEVLWLVDTLASTMADMPASAAAEKTRISAEYATIEAVVVAQRARLDAL